MVLDGFHWESGDRTVVDIISEAGAVATISGNSVGTTKLTVTNDACAYPLEIIVKCVSAAYASNQRFTWKQEIAINTVPNNNKALRYGGLFNI